jgi:hypothetical protein
MRITTEWLGRRRVGGVMAAAAGLLLLLPGTASPRAEEGLPVAEEYGSTYARLRYTEGGTTIRRVQQGLILEDAQANAPLVPGDRIETAGGRAEIVLADGATVWLEVGSLVELRTLADVNNRYDRTNLLVLEDGTIRIEAVETGDGALDFRVDTEAGSVRLLSAGSFRIDADGSVTTVSSFSGVAEILGDAGTVLVRSGERSTVRPGRVPAAPRPFNTARLDDFDRFCQDRLAAYLRPGDAYDPDREEAIQEELPPEVRPHYNELSVYGSWHYLSPYGWVWHPVYAGSWGPYLRGYWTWCPTGWVWVSYDPWGWAPYRYGRWDFVASVGWFWIPGRVWRGAWVGFAVGRSYLGWCPLNYYNRPVFHDLTIVNVINVRPGRLDPRGWRFVPVGRIADRGLRTVRADRLPPDTDLVLTGRLPRFDPREVARRPEAGRGLQETVRRQDAWLPAAGTPRRAVPFRELERVAPGRSPATRPAPSIGSRVPRPRLQDARPAPVPARPGRVSDLRRGSADRPASRNPGGLRPAPRRPEAVVPRPTGSQRQPSALPPPRPRAPQAGPASPAGPRRVAPPSRPGDRSRGHAVERLFERARGETIRGRPGPPRQRMSPPASGQRVGQPPAGGRSQGKRPPAPPPRREKPDRKR